MKIASLRIENFRSFQDQTIQLNKYTCFVGPNGAGKSTVLCALNVFFQDSGSSTNVSDLCDEDFYGRDVARPVKVTVEFDDMSEEAKIALADYVRQDRLVVSAVAEFNAETGRAQVRHFGNRAGMTRFAPFFEAVSGNARAEELNRLFGELQAEFPDLPTGSSVRSKDAKIAALREYEAARPDECEMIPSEDKFYGINSTGILARFVQWVYVPAVKDAGDESQEGKNTALGKLVARAVTTRTNFDAQLDELKRETRGRYDALLEANRHSLTDISDSLQRRLEDWAHPNVRIGMEWIADAGKAVQLQTPVAGIKTGDGDFLGSLARMGHGLQRSYLLALLQELAGSDAPNAPTLILGVEEPELYQHPPQARHLADVFCELADDNNQILVTTHSPYFVSGEGFEDIRLVRSGRPVAGTSIASCTHQSLCERIRLALGENPLRAVDGLVAKLHQMLQPAIAEMFFAQVPVLVEGLEDVAYILTHLHLTGMWSEFRRLGCHLVPVSGKSSLIKPLVIAKQLAMPVFVVFDADGNIEGERRAYHEHDNRAILHILDSAVEVFPNDDIVGVDHCIWKTNLTEAVRADFGAEYAGYIQAARQNLGHEGGLEKNELFISDWLAVAYQDGQRSATLNGVCEAILRFATALHGQQRQVAAA